MSKRNFLDSYSKEFLGIVKRAKNADEFHCIPCNEDITLATAGKVKKFLCIPASNAFVERIFSLTSAQWTDVRNSLNVDTVKSLTQVKVNYDLSCPEFYKMLISNRNLLKSIMDGQKYKI